MIMYVCNLTSIPEEPYKNTYQLQLSVEPLDYIMFNIHTLLKYIYGQ